MWYDSSYNYVGYVGNSNALPQTFTSPANARYCKYYWADISQSWLNYSNPAQVGYGGVLDVETGLLTVDTHFVTIDGNSNIGMEASTWNPNIPVFYISLTNKGKFDGLPNIVSNVGQAVTRSVLITTSLPWLFAFTGSGTYLDWSAPYTSVAEMKTFLNTTPIEVAYKLDTPQTYQLTPVQVKTLLGYNNIWTDSGTVTVSVPNMISVVNEGNTTAKPTMTIYGSGNIGVWLNGMQVFQIALGDTGNITIDAEQGGILRNRLVTGDYSNFVLQKGENTISVTGNVTNVEITNYSRWL